MRQGMVLLPPRSHPAPVPQASDRMARPCPTLVSLGPARSRGHHIFDRLGSLIDSFMDLLSQVFRLRFLYAGTICREQLRRPEWTWPWGAGDWRRPARW